MKYLFIKLSFLFSLFTGIAAAQIPTAAQSPDSANNVSIPWAAPNPVWHISNPIGINNLNITTPPTLSAVDDTSDYLELYDFGFNVPATANIVGVEVVFARGGCTAGSYFWDTLSLSSNGLIIGNYAADSGSLGNAIDTVGGPADLWGASLSPAVVNSSRFGLLYNMQSVGACAGFRFINCKMRIYYATPTGINSAEASKTISIYPNPSGSSITIGSTGPLTETNYYLVDALGRKLLNGSFTGEKTTLDVSSIPAGLYFIKFSNDTHTYKFTKM